MKRLFPGLLTVVSFVISTYLIIHPFSWSPPLNTCLILLLDFIVILGAIYFGIKGVIIFGAFSLFVVLLHSLRISEFMILPILLLSATISIFYCYYLKINNFARRINSEIDSIEEEKNVLTVELEYSRLENASLKQKLQRYTALKDLTEILSSSLSLDKAAPLITEETFRLLGKSCAGLLYILDKKKQQLNLVSTKLTDPQYEIKLKVGDIFDNWVFKQRRPLMVEDIKKDFRFNIQDIKEEDLRGVRSLISAPLISENKLLGILRLDSVSRNAYDSDDLRLLDIISDLSAVTIENTLLYQETEKLAITDGLSDLFVHRYFQERFEQEVHRGLWTHSCFAFLMLDIDNFKSYNDRYGHIAGDIVLKQIAKLIKSSTSPGDIVARYGGEEFGVLLVDTPKSEALKVAQAIREKVEKKKFILRRQATNVTVSGGIAFFPEEGKVRESLIKRADQALYKAKAEGKNKICTY